MLRWRTENLFKELTRKKVAIVMKNRNKDRKNQKGNLEWEVKEEIIHGLGGNHKNSDSTLSKREPTGVL